MRWHCTLPTGFPHCTSEDDIHEGYFTPKDSLIFPNIWFACFPCRCNRVALMFSRRQMLNDPSAYPDLSKFDPERFLVFGGNKIQRDPYEMCFGFGRRYVHPSKVLTFVIDRKPSTVEVFAPERSPLTQPSLSCVRRFLLS